MYIFTDQIVSYYFFEMSRFIRCRVKKWSKQEKKHVFKNETVYKYSFASYQPSEMYLIYVALNIGKLYAGVNENGTSKNDADDDDLPVSEHILILHRSDIPKLNQALKEMRTQKYESYFIMIEAIRDFICEYKRQDKFVFVSEQY